MRVTEVTTTIRYSAEGKGAWRSIEVGATAILTAPGETLEVAQQELYARLSRQLKTLWANGSGTASQDAPEGHQAVVPPSSPRLVSMVASMVCPSRPGTVNTANFGVIRSKAP